ncbi:TetR/AcrR family transcriptional regulator [Tropicibacter naphthalenivorans]|uniref:Fatty acid metabolism regulator protein n=1 Tax=Tropicibacter naphthalenivorans TaxID=441103 RepID=A0A0P1GH45_9RHOB|nr:TetR/AcrR family transcriptional regulator [Tropicibacter naphthalenivorans]CUH81166.1 Fatty acid metabolism regulator protein [Tropicibacter naphthalenivorans]SMC97504.1 transcriptional regulator, TetR family [Tropicibacter naphthalenivorans]
MTSGEIRYAIAGKRKRARSDGEKEARRGAILNAARAMIGQTGFESLTMNAIAKEAGVSKGTLYLYARTKEELLLALFADAMEQVVQQIEAEATPETLARVLVDAPAQVPVFLPLLARLFTVIETNIAPEPLFEQKRRMREMGLRVAQVLAAQTGASLERTREASMVLMLSMQGAAQFDIAAARKPDDVPEDLAPMFAKETFRTSYAMAVRLVLDGLS